MTLFIEITPHFAYWQFAFQHKRRMRFVDGNPCVHVVRRFFASVLRECEHDVVCFSSFLVSQFDIFNADETDVDSLFLASGKDCGRNGRVLFHSVEIECPQIVEDAQHVIGLAFGFQCGLLRRTSGAQSRALRMTMLWRV